MLRPGARGRPGGGVVLTALSRLVRAWDLRLGADGFWHGACPACQDLFGRVGALTLYADFFHCTDCGLQGREACLRDAEGGMTVTRFPKQAPVVVIPTIDAACLAARKEVEALVALTKAQRIELILIFERLADALEGGDEAA